MTIVYEVLATPEARQEGLSLQARKYREVGYLGPDDGDEAVLDKYVDSATYFGARDASGALIGVARLIPYTEELGVPSLSDFELLPDALDWFERADKSKIAEFSALAVEADTELGLTVSKGLYRAIAQYSLVVTGQTLWVAALASRVRALLTRVIRLDSKPLAKRVHYRGAPTIPVLIDVVEYFRRIAEKDPVMSDYFTRGLTIDLTTGKTTIDDAVLAFLPVVPSEPVSEVTTAT